MTVTGDIFFILLQTPEKLTKTLLLPGAAVGITAVAMKVK